MAANGIMVSHHLPVKTNKQSANFERNIIFFRLYFVSRKSFNYHHGNCWTKIGVISNRIQWRSLIISWQTCAWLDNLQHRISNEFVMYWLEEKKTYTSSLTVVAHNCAVVVHSRQPHQSCFAFDLFSRFHVRIVVVQMSNTQRSTAYTYNSNCFMATFYYNISKIHVCFILNSYFTSCFKVNIT